MRLFDRVIQPRLGAAVGELFATSFYPGILRIELADPSIRLCFQRCDPFSAQRLGILGY